jgi:hypothetical protein
LKPGGHLLAFGATRTYHRMTVAIEDAGFEIRDSIHWTYGSGFPKSLNVAIALDKQAGAMKHRGKRVSVAGNRNNGGEDIPNAFNVPQHQGITDAAREWSGWGTALKPSHEPIVVARKPLVGTVAGNVLEHGTGALNIDGCRVGSEGGTKGVSATVEREKHGKGSFSYGHDVVSLNAGRWPANTVLTHAAECGSTCVEGCPVAALDQQSGVSKSTPSKPTVRKADVSGETRSKSGAGMYAEGAKKSGHDHNDSGGASRFFTTTEWDPEWDVPFLYVAKPGKKERNAGLDGLPKGAGPETQNHDFRKKSGTRSSMSRANHHPTVKPVALMRHLIRLVTPPNGTVLDPFLGSGTTAVAAILEGYDWKGCEMTDDYLPIIKGRVKHALKKKGEPDA